MNKDSNLLDLTSWQPPVFFAPWIPFKNPVHPPPSTAPTSEKTLDRLIILAHHYPPSSVSRVNNSLVSLSSNPLVDLSINPVRLNNYFVVFDPEYFLLTILFGFPVPVSLLTPLHCK
ncbi:hypothetical protein ATANTOWER_016621 [Ataeniobius toweri]|uniref:Uncharacterized protein n=1 Tax=Ataeniobius toweri TaxID=208326 RepID=A0ABU7B719_9TELE|nr:hypothetical protein [Ataeniobius toweri]